MDEAGRAESVASSICPSCGFGSLVKHCPPTNRCAWWRCDVADCDYIVDLARGLVVKDLPTSLPGVDFARGDEGDQGEG